MVETRRGAFDMRTYFTKRQQELNNEARLHAQKVNLKIGYRRAQDLITETGWTNPLTGTEPNVLLMGFEGFHTADTFVDFVHSKNPAAKIAVADFSHHPLQECYENGLDKVKGVQLVEADTTALGFADESFDQIETDGLLQWLSPDQKRKAIAEWFRVLRPGGIVTTRDRSVSILEDTNTWDRYTRIRKEFYNRFGSVPYATTTEVLQYQFKSQGFETTMIPDQSERKGRKLMYDIVAKKPEIQKAA